MFVQSTTVPLLTTDDKVHRIYLWLRISRTFSNMEQSGTLYAVVSVDAQHGCNALLNGAVIVPLLIVNFSSVTFCVLVTRY